MIRSYSELIKLPTFEERFRYLSLSEIVGSPTFGFDRYLNQAFYRSKEWRRIRDYVIIRDDGCDLGIEDRKIGRGIIVHHMNPITPDSIEHRDPDLLNPEYLICVSHTTHNAITFGDESLLVSTPVERRPGDTCPWKAGRM